MISNSHQIDYLQQNAAESHSLKSNHLFIDDHSILAQKSSCPIQQDWTEAKNVLRYLQATINPKLGSTTAEGKMAKRMEEIGAASVYPTVVYEDNQSCSGRSILRPPDTVLCRTYGRRTSPLISLQHCSTEMLADILAKPLQ